MDDPTNILFGIGALIAIAMILLATFGGQTGSDHIDTHIDNDVTGYDPITGAYRVEARNIRNITGPNPHVSNNLPANIWSTGKKGEYVVDPNHAFDSPGGLDDVRNSNVQWQDVPPGEWEIVARGYKPRNFIREQLEGYDDYHYLKKKGERSE